MNEEELVEEKKKNQKEYELSIDNIKAMEQTIEIKNYLKELENKTQKEEYQKFLNSLEVGIDGTIFAPTGGHRYATAFLVDFITYAFTLKFYAKQFVKSDWPYMEISFTSLLNYNINARKILKEKKKYPDEKIIENPYGLEVYQNPRENLECSETCLLRNCIFAPGVYNFQKELEVEGMINLVVDDKNKKIIIHDNEEADIAHYSNFEPIDISKLNMRDQNAFFGEEAQKILGVKIEDKWFGKNQDDGTIKKKPYTK